MKKILALTLAAAAFAAAAPPAAASQTVRVTFGMSAGRYAPTGAACPLTVAAGANGLDVLDAAVAAHCIVSYSTVTYAGYGTFVTCINAVCGNSGTGTLGTYWNMYENGGSTWYGVDGFSADEGDELAFAYQEFCFEAVCPPV